MQAARSLTFGRMMRSAVFLGVWAGVNFCARRLSWYEISLAVPRVAVGREHLQLEQSNFLHYYRRRIRLADVLWECFFLSLALSCVFICIWYTREARCWANKIRFRSDPLLSIFYFSLAEYIRARRLLSCSCNEFVFVWQILLLSRYQFSILDIFEREVKFLRYLISLRHLLHKVLILLHLGVLTINWSGSRGPFWTLLNSTGIDKKRDFYRLLI